LRSRFDQAAKLHLATEPLLLHAALLAPEPIPLFLFAEAREEFAEPLSSALADDGLDEAVAALRAFALLDRATRTDPYDPMIRIATVQLHRLVRQVAQQRCEGPARAGLFIVACFSSSAAHTTGGGAAGIGAAVMFAT
jgi:hypothetical protein